MTFSITGLGSGFDINTMVSQLVALKQSTMLTPLENKINELNTKNTALTTLKSKFSTLQSSLNTFTKAIYDSSSDIWNKTSVSSSDENYVSASATGNVAAAKLELFVEQIATATTAKSIHSIGNNEKLLQTEFKDLVNGQTEAGSFSMFLNGKEYNIEIDENDTLETIIKNINEETKGVIKAEFNQETGKFSLTAQKEADGEFAVDKDANLLLGSSGDTSNFLLAFKLYNKVDGGIESAYALSAVNTSVAMNDEKSGLAGLKFYDSEGNLATSGKIIINGAEIEVDEEMSINDVIKKINATSNTNVKASYDSLTNRVILTSTQTGQSNISLASDGTNLLNILGLTQGEGENEILANNSQELGQNAIIHINGNKVVSNSNTITGESSGITNLSLTIKKPTSDYSGNQEDVKSVTLEANPDSSAIKEALEKFVTAYNDVVTTTKTMTQADGKIGRDASLNSVLSQLRSITSKVADVGGEFSMLAQIGIESDKEEPSKLKLDSSKLEKALQQNTDSVKKLLSDGYVAKEDNGIFDSLIANINNILDTERGYFTTQTQSVDNLIKSTNSRIERANERILNYEIRMTKQFNKMDSTISNLNAQLSTFQSYI